MDNHDEEEDKSPTSDLEEEQPTLTNNGESDKHLVNNDLDIDDSETPKQ